MKALSRVKILSGILGYNCLIPGRWKEIPPMPGDLVALVSAPDSKWCLSWLVSKQWNEGWVCEQFTLESVEDGEVANWHNVGIAVFERERVTEHPEWRWTDRQHRFNARWFRSCRGEDGLRAVNVQFDGQSATLRIRRKWTSDIKSKLFVDFRKVTKAMMLEFYRSVVEDTDLERRSIQ